MIRFCITPTSSASLTKRGVKVGSPMLSIACVRIDFTSVQCSIEDPSSAEIVMTMPHVADPAKVRSFSGASLLFFLLFKMVTSERPDKAMTEIYITLDSRRFAFCCGYKAVKLRDHELGGTF